MSLNHDLNTLHRYFIYANKMRIFFYECLDKSDKIKSNSKVVNFDKTMYLSLWYGLLYVVVEGWRKLGLKDSKINNLLKDKNTELLKNFRNGTFHFSKEYNDSRFENFYNEPTTVQWITKLNAEFSRYFLESLEK